MKTRAISSAVLIPLILVVLFIGPWAFALLVLAATLTAGYEYTQMLQHQRYKVPLFWVWVMVLLWEIDAFWDLGGLELGMVSVIMFSVGWQVFYREQHPNEPNPTANWALALAGGLYLGVGGAYLIRVRGLADGLWWTLMALPVVWIADSGAYFAGLYLGRRPMAPHLSPNKTWEGYIGELGSGMLAGLLLGALWSGLAPEPTTLTSWRGLLLGGVLGALTPLGDLFVSMVKRETGVKDSGKLIPGHGGAFDRIDSLLWSGILTWAFIQLFT